MTLLRPLPMWSIDQPGSLFAELSGVGRSRDPEEIQFTPLASASPHRLFAHRQRYDLKSRWLATVFGAREGRSAKSFTPLIAFDPAGNFREALTQDILWWGGGGN